MPSVRLSFCCLSRNCLLQDEAVPTWLECRIGTPSDESEDAAVGEATPTGGGIGGPATLHGRERVQAVAQPQPLHEAGLGDVRPSVGHVELLDRFLKLEGTHRSAKCRFHLSILSHETRLRDGMSARQLAPHDFLFIQADRSVVFLLLASLWQRSITGGQCSNGKEA